jgi:hypothetical protein
MAEPFHSFAGKVAVEALKPTATFTTALLQPVLRRLEEWAGEEDLQRRIVNARLRPVFEAYIKNLLPHISRTRSVVFPSLSVPIAAIYEPLTVSVQADDGTVRVSAEQLAEGQIPRLLIEDAAGMGKSTFARALGLAILQRSERIPVFVELHRLREGETVLEHVLGTIDPLGAVFDRGLLLALVALGDFFIILDGLDEVPRPALRAVTAEISALSRKIGDSVLLVTSRPEGPTGGLSPLPIGRLDTLSRIQTESLLRRYDSFAGTDVSNGLIPQLDRAPAAFLRTPLFVGLLYQVFGYTNEVAPRLHLFYSSVYNALYKGQDLAKHAAPRPKRCGLEIDQLRDFLGIFSYRNTLESKFFWHEDTNFYSDIRAISQQLPWVQCDPGDIVEDFLLNVPLFFRDGRAVSYLHRTLADYFCADFLATNPRGSDIVARLARSGSVGMNFGEVFSFLEGINPRMFQNAVLRPRAEEFVRQHGSLPSSLDPTMKCIAASCASLYATTLEVSRIGGATIGTHREVEGAKWITRSDIGAFRITLTSEFKGPPHVLGSLGRWSIHNGALQDYQVAQLAEPELEGKCLLDNVNVSSYAWLLMPLLRHAQYMLFTSGLFVDRMRVETFLNEITADEAAWLERVDLWGDISLP